MANPYYVEPLGGVNIGQGLVGLGSLMREKKKEDQAYQESLKQQERQTRAQEEMLRVLDSGTPKEMAGFLAEFPEMGDVFKQAYGFTAPQTEGIVKDFGARILATDDPEKAKTAISEMIMAYQDAGVSAPTNTIAAFQELQEGEEGALDRIKMITMALNPDLREGFMKGQGDKEFMKEERQYATSAIKALKKRSSEVSGAIKKIENLVPEVKKGGSAGRTAAGAMIMSLARLVSPGVVTEGDFKAMAGAADPLATLMDRLQGREGTEPLLDQLQKAYDPTNPNLLNPDQIKDIASSLVAAEAPSILQEFDEAGSRARRAGLNERQYKTIFGEEDDLQSIKGLRKYVDFQGSETVTNLPSQNAQGWILMTDANGNKAYVSPDGSQFEAVQ